MGTNFYLRENVCPKCKRHDEPKHIGKLSGGWTFSFRGYKSEDLVSWAAWQKKLAAAVADGAKIANEYGEEISLEDFKAMVENKKTATRNQTTYCREREHPSVADYYWLDDEGNSFCDCEFS